METDELDTLLRRADQLDRPVPVEALIEKSMHGARQRARNRRMAVIGSLGASLAAVVAIAGLALGPGPSVPMSPAGTAKPLPSHTTPPSNSDQQANLPTTAELKKITEAKLPERMTLRQISTEGLWGTGITFELGDQDGYGLAGVGIDRVSWAADKQTCTAAATVTCVQRAVAGGVVWIARDQEKPGDATRYSLIRPDGTRVSFFQRNQLDGQVDRDDLPLSDREAIKLITAADWHEHLDRLPLEAPWEGQGNR